jgi:hypothetical protein
LLGLQERVPKASAFSYGQKNEAKRPKTV